MMRPQPARKEDLPVWLIERAKKACAGLLVLLVISTGAPHATAQSIDVFRNRGRVTGLPIPRYVSLDASRARMRVGPGTDYRIKWVYTGIPVPLEVLAEYSNWRQVRDSSGETGWMHQSLLSGRRTAVVNPWQDRLAPLRNEDAKAATPLARIEPGAVVFVEGCNGRWCQVRTRSPDVEGWIDQNRLWGVYPGEIIDGD